MASGLAQEQLERVGRRLERLRGRRWRRRLLRLGLPLRLGEQLDAAPVELLVDRLRFERVELERLQHVHQLDLPELSARLGGLEQRRQLLARENRLDLDRAHMVPLNRRSLDVLPAC